MAVALACLGILIYAQHSSAQGDVYVSMRGNYSHFNESCYCQDIRICKPAVASLAIGGWPAICGSVRNIVPKVCCDTPLVLGGALMRKMEEEMEWRAQWNGQLNTDCHSSCTDIRICTAAKASLALGGFPKVCGFVDYVVPKVCCEYPFVLGNALERKIKEEKERHALSSYWNYTHFNENCYCEDIRICKRAVASLAIGGWPPICGWVSNVVPKVCCEIPIVLGGALMRKIEEEKEWRTLWNDHFTPCSGCTDIRICTEAVASLAIGGFPPVCGLVDDFVPKVCCSKTEVLGKALRRKIEEEKERHSYVNA
ncbi:unnamed protein product [Larinioides sclopetarius]|uniref:Uncharacterized protein n=1 Tax=Larinioides sclopetarius TaxID=280406 RepID=A0AAV1ZAZ3_9ARAC